MILLTLGTLQSLFEFYFCIICVCCIRNQHPCSRLCSCVQQVKMGGSSGRLYKCLPLDTTIKMDLEIGFCPVLNSYFALSQHLVLAVRSESDYHKNHKGTYLGRRLNWLPYFGFIYIWVRKMFIRFEVAEEIWDQEIWNLKSKHLFLTSPEYS